MITTAAPRSDNGLAATPPGGKVLAAVLRQTELGGRLDHGAAVG